MSDFEKRKEEYLERLSTNTQYVKSLTEKKDERSRATLRIMVDPRNEKELKMATSTLDFAEDCMNLLTNAACGNVEPIPIEENEGLKAITSIMKMLISGEEITEETMTAKLNNSKSGNVSPEQLAKVIYGMLIGFISNPEEAMTYVCNEMGVSLDNEVDLIRLQVLLEEAQTRVQALQPSPDPYKEMTDKNLDEFVAFAEAFHNLCEKNIKKEDSMDLDALVYKLLRDLR